MDVTLDASERKYCLGICWRVPALFVELNSAPINDYLLQSLQICYLGIYPLLIVL